jgi:hypothetical protein
MPPPTTFQTVHLHFGKNPVEHFDKPARSFLSRSGAGKARRVQPAYILYGILKGSSGTGETRDNNIIQVPFTGDTIPAD